MEFATPFSVVATALTRRRTPGNRTHSELGPPRPSHRHSLSERSETTYGAKPCNHPSSRSAHLSLFKLSIKKLVPPPSSRSKNPADDFMEFATPLSVVAQRAATPHPSRKHFHQRTLQNDLPPHAVHPSPLAHLSRCGSALTLQLPTSGAISRTPPLHARLKPTPQPWVPRRRPEADA
jgi:hypothetical protein